MSRSLLILLALFLPRPLISQVRILMPVVVKDAGGKDVTDLKMSDFQITGPKSTKIENMWLIPAQGVSEQGRNIPITVLYDAADARDPNPEVKAKWILAFLSDVAQHRAPVAFYITTADGPRLIYDPATPPEVLSAALMLIEKSQAASADPQVEQQTEKLKLIRSTAQVRTFRFDYVFNQMKSLMELARLLPASDKRRPIVWLTSSFFGWPHDQDISMQEAMCEQFNASRISLYPLEPEELRSSPIGTMEQLARMTGGSALNSGTMWNGPMWNVLQGMLGDFGPYYMLGVAFPTPREEGWISVKIKVSRPGLTVRGAPGFYGLKPTKR